MKIKKIKKIKWQKKKMNFLRRNKTSVSNILVSRANRHPLFGRLFTLSMLFQPPKSHPLCFFAFSLFRFFIINSIFVVFKAFLWNKRIFPFCELEMNNLIRFEGKRNNYFNCGIYLFNFNFEIFLGNNKTYFHAKILSTE